MSGVFIATYVALWIVVLLQAVLLIGLTKALHEMRSEQTEGATFQGRPVPKFSARDLVGNTVSSATISGAPAALLFVSPNCDSCMVTLDELKPLATDRSRGLFVICDGTTADCSQLALDYRITAPVIADENAELKRLFGVAGTPVAVRVNARGVIESHGEPARGDELEEFLASGVKSNNGVAEPTIGEVRV